MKSNRGVAPAVGVVLLVMIAAVMAASVMAIAVDADTPSTSTVVIDVEADTSGELRFVHRGGSSLDPDVLSLFVSVDGQPLAYQPPIPFFSATGFVSAPTGPFNSATGGEWQAGELASFRIASTNDPDLTEGGTVRVELVSGTDRILELTTTVRGSFRDGAPSRK